MSEERVIELPEDDPEIIRAMVFWMYENTICIPKAVAKFSSSMEDPDDTRALQTTSGYLVRLYTVGEKLPVARTSKSCSRRQCQALDRDRWGRDLGIIAYAYQNTLSDSPLRRLLIQVAKIDIYGEYFKEAKSRLLMCPEFLYDMAFSYMKGINTLSKAVSLRKMICQDFHMHPAGHKGTCELKGYIVYGESELLDEVAASGNST